jgi:O-antigen/teichoic acid export membrane protein
MGTGAMSLVVGRLAGAGVSAVMLLAFSPIPYRLGLDRRLLRRLLDFGLPLAGASLVVFAIGFVDQLTVGRVLGPTALGVYVLAYNLASWPVQIISQPLRNVAPAILARQQHDPELMRGTFQQMAVPLAIVAVPGCAALAVAAPDVVELVYGQEWAAAAVPLRWLAVFAAFRILFELCYDFVVVAGSSRPLLGVQLLWLAGLVPLVGVGVVRFGLIGAALAQVLLAVLIIGPAYLVILRGLHVRIAVLALSLLWPMVGAILLVVAVGLVQTTGASAWQVLVVVALATLVVVGALASRFRTGFAAWRVATPEDAGVPA